MVEPSGMHSLPNSHAADLGIQYFFQDRLLAGATIAPVILASNKTKPLQFQGNQTAWPVYLSIGNI
jgi:hypothetical protein